MRYMRVEENAMDSPKFIAIGDRAWRLWCEGGTYCQKHLTDGLIPLKALRGFRYYSKSAVQELLAVNVPEKGPLWHLRANPCACTTTWTGTTPERRCWPTARPARTGSNAGARNRRRNAVRHHRTKRVTKRDVTSLLNGTERNRTILRKEHRRKVSHPHARREASGPAS